MNRINELLDEYGESHQHPTNKQIHWVCVPLIVWSLLGMIWSIRTPDIFSSLPLILNWAVILIIFSMIYYLIVSTSLAMGILIVFLLMLGPIYWLEQVDISLLNMSVVIFIIAWIGQFIGHSIEGKRPSFLKDLQFLLIGPLWLLSFVYKRFGINY